MSTSYVLKSRNQVPFGTINIVTPQFIVVFLQAGHQLLSAGGTAHKVSISNFY